MPLVARLAASRPKIKSKNGGLYLQTQQTLLERQYIPGTQQTLFLTQHSINQTQERFIETQHSIIETQHNNIQTKHDICKTQHKILPIT